MHLTTAPLLHRVLTFGKSQRYTNTLGAIISVAWLLGFIIHATMDEFLLHAVGFGLSVYVIGYQTSRLLSERVRDPVYRAKAQGMARFGICKCSTKDPERKAICALCTDDVNPVAASCGYILWLIDRWVCDVLIKVRGIVGFPLAFLFELHGWYDPLATLGDGTFRARG